MAIPAWQERVEVIDVAQRIPYAESEKLFAFDCSGSTRGHIMSLQQDFVLGLTSKDADYVCKWDTDAESPRQIADIPSEDYKHYFQGIGGTEPSCLLRHDTVVEKIKGSDVWFLLTDGDIWDREVQNLTQLAEVHNVNDVPVILLITGSGRGRPQDKNVSVGISFFANAPDVLFLYKETTDGEIFVLDAKGIFAGLKGKAESDLSTWDNLARFANEAALKEALTSQNVTFDGDRASHTRKGISLGPEWEANHKDVLVNIEKLLSQQVLNEPDLVSLLQDQALNSLALACKVRGQISRLHSLLVRHKQAEVVVRLQDFHGATPIMQMLQASTDADEKTRLSTALRKAHAANRKTYQDKKDRPDENSQRITRLNRMIDRALRVLAEMEKSSFTADILDRRSNRARRADAVAEKDSAVKLASLDLSPKTEAFRSFCPICCGDNEIMSVVLKRSESAQENTTDFALNFPLATAYGPHNENIISSQAICFQCANLLERSIYQEDIVATIPTADFDGTNREYINHQLYLGLTAGLATGSSGVVQLFGAIIGRTLETKSWCAALDKDGDAETAGRRDLLTWLQRNLLENCSCRENFNETGGWVKLFEAVTWAVHEFDSAGLDAWIIQYPLTGFNVLMRWCEDFELGFSQGQLIAIQHGKLLNLVTTKIMDQVFKSGYVRDWMVPYLEFVYTTFNAPGIPRDLGADSIVNGEHFWQKMGIALGREQYPDVRVFLQILEPNREHMSARRVQITTFWALFRNQGHMKPKTFFAKMMDEFPLALTILNTQKDFSTQAVEKELVSLFAQEVPKDEAFRLHNSGLVPPFVSPYGASVLKCGILACSHPFFSEDELREGRIEPLSLRDKRCEHLKSVFGFNASLVEKSTTGLPEATSAPAPPTMNHVTLHVSIAKIWDTLFQAERQSVMSAVEIMKEQQPLEPALQQFVDNVQVRICTTSGRGNIYHQGVRADTLTVLPSFIEALRNASRQYGLEDGSGCSWKMDFPEHNVLQWKMEYELKLTRESDSGDAMQGVETA